MKWTFLLLLFPLLANGATPVQTQSTPIVCPPRNSIIQQGLSPFLVQNAGGNWIGGFLAQNAGTSNLWTFMFGSIPAANRTVAMTMLVAALPTIGAPVGPIHVNANQWQCSYPNLANYMAIAIYPPIGCEQCANPA